jgi:hypothetical protein
LVSDTVDIPLKSEIAIHAIVSAEVTADGAARLLHKLHSELSTADGFRHHDGPLMNAFIYLYSSEAHYTSGMAQWVAMLARTGVGAFPEVQIRREAIDALIPPAEKKFGLSEKERVNVFESIVRAEDRAGREARARFPDSNPGTPGYSPVAARKQLDQQVQLQERLSHRYKAQLQRRYGLDDSVLLAIRVEARTKNWPFPQWRE